MNNLRNTIINNSNVAGKGKPALLAAFLFLIFYTGCESIIEFPGVPVTDPVVIIEAILTDKMEEQSVRVSYSMALDDTLSDGLVRDAEVYLYSENSDTVYYRYTDNGWYKSLPFQAEINKTYILEVKADTNIYQSHGTAIKLDEVDSVYYISSFDPETRDSVFFVHVDGEKKMKK